ncbi:hypothetical protein ACFVXE_35625 [Streptomyces sp. NPDC058231]|uniref:hypothetical protein n=1 Tax=Streptomyces sp. NPDC058231 TaxID=3346392 RepID=UPI0036E7CA5A
MPVVYGEVALGAGVGGDGVEPGLAAGQGGGVAAEFVGGVVGQSVAGPGGGADACGVEWFVLAQDGAVDA